MSMVSRSGKGKACVWRPKKLGMVGLLIRLIDGLVVQSKSHAACVGSFFSNAVSSFVEVCNLGCFDPFHIKIVVVDLANSAIIVKEDAA
jgi:hypothetical protein